jgi:16S rRNA pseudouridine516 synthase
VSGVRLDKLVANLGYGSRKDVQAMVRAGRIRLGAAPVAEADRKLSPQEAGSLLIDGEPIDPLPGVVLLMNKPAGLTCSTKEAGPLVYDLLPERWRRRDPPLSTVGRLDKDTSGLLLLTDDGALLHKIISPKTHLPKRYRATLARPLHGDEAEVFAAGTLMLDGETKPLLPARLEVLGPTEAHLTIVEGRYHQVRRMFAALGNHVLVLHRDALGEVTLPEDLPEGGIRPLSEAEVSAALSAGNFHTQVT